MRISIKARVIGSLALAAWVSTVVAHAHEHTSICFAEMPTYTQSAPYVQTGVWADWLFDGSSVVMPDGDTATCRNGQVTVS